MSAQPLPVYQDEWGLTDETHEAVLRELEEEYPDQVDLVGLDRTYRDLGLDLYEGPEVEPGAYMQALRSLDKRQWHQRGVDALTQFHMPTFDESEFDLMLRQHNYNYTDANTDYSRDDAHRKRKNLPKGDLDFARVSFREDHVLMEVWEVKTNAEDLEKSDQLDRHFRTARQLEDETGFEVRVRDRELEASQIQEKMQSTGDEYSIPRRYTGSTLVSSGSENVLDSEDFEVFQDGFMGELVLDDEIEEIQSQQEFF